MSELEKPDYLAGHDINGSLRNSCQTFDLGGALANVWSWERVWEYGVEELGHDDEGVGTPC